MEAEQVEEEDGETPQTTDDAAKAQKKGKDEKVWKKKDKETKNGSK